MAKTIFDEIQRRLREVGMVSTEREFCEQWLGKSECYLRGLRFHSMDPSADALANCAARLAWASDGLRAQRAMGARMLAEALDDLRLECYRQIDQQAQTKWKQKGVCA